MNGRWRLWLLGIAAVLLVPFAVDWMGAQGRIDDILIESALDAPSVVADGRHRIGFIVRVTDRGRPCAGVLLQAWILEGSGLFYPDFVYTDEQGTARFTFSPNRLTRYERQDAALIRVRDIGIGRLVEVGKDLTVTVPLASGEEGAPEGGGFLAP